VDTLEGFLRSLSSADPKLAAEAISNWQAAGIVEPPPSSGDRHSTRHVGTSISVIAAELPDSAAFDSPIGDQYIYDHSG
jgi:hypothetical protein